MNLLTIKELSLRLKIKESTLYTWASRGLLPSFKLNGLLRFDQKEIEQWIKNSKIVAKSAGHPQSKPIANNEIDEIIKSAIESFKA